MVQQNTFDIIYDNHLTKYKSFSLKERKGDCSTCFKRSCAENLARLSLGVDADIIGLILPIPPDSRSSCSIIAGTKNKQTNKIIS